jgi:hypothetical protein
VTAIEQRIVVQTRDVVVVRGEDVDLDDDCGVEERAMPRTPTKPRKSWPSRSMKP